MAGEVEVIKAVEGNGTRRRNMIGNGISIERKRVAAYVRVSTDAEEQLQSFQSQKLYYQEKISQNKEWVMVGIYADEAVTGTKTVKRDGFLKMINDCMAGMVDVILTKSISRFSRNLVDTLQYVCMLKDKGIAVIFEKENINTFSMESEMALALLSTLAQNEVESLSANVKLGIKMKMRRGEMMGFNGCLGYDYHSEDKSITVNPEEAEIVREIFDMYLRGYGAPTIAKELIRLGRKNKKGEVKWTESGIRTVINNGKIRETFVLEKHLRLIRFQNAGWKIWVRRNSITSKNTTNLLFRLKFGMQRRRLKKAVTVQMQCLLKGQERSTAGSLPLAVCVNVDSAGNI